MQRQETCQTLKLSVGFVVVQRILAPVAEKNAM